MGLGASTITWPDLRLNIGVVGEGREPIIAAGLVLQRIGCRVIGAKWTMLSAMGDDPFEIRDRLVVVGGRLHGPRLIGAVHGRDAAANIFEHDIGGGKSADVATSSGERNPRRGVGQFPLVDHLGRCL